MQEHSNKPPLDAAVSKPIVNPPPRTRRRIVPVKGSAEPAVADRRKRRTSFKKADVTRAISAVTKGGLIPGSVEIAPDGNIRIYAVGSEPIETLFDKWSDRL